MSKNIDAPFKPVTESYNILGQCGVVLDVFFSRKDAIQAWLVHYKPRLYQANYSMVYIKDGIRYNINPSGSL